MTYATHCDKISLLAFIHQIRHFWRKNSATIWGKLSKFNLKNYLEFRALKITGKIYLVSFGAKIQMLPWCATHQRTRSPPPRPMIIETDAFFSCDSTVRQCSPQNPKSVKSKPKSIFGSCLEKNESRLWKIAFSCFLASPNCTMQTTESGELRFKK